MSGQHLKVGDWVWAVNFSVRWHSGPFKAERREVVSVGRTYLTITDPYYPKVCRDDLTVWWDPKRAPPTTRCEIFVDQAEAEAYAELLELNRELQNVLTSLHSANSAIGKSVTSIAKQVPSSRDVRGADLIRTNAETQAVLQRARNAMEILTKVQATFAALTELGTPTTPDQGGAPQDPAPSS